MWEEENAAVCFQRDWFHFEETMNEQVFAEHFVVFFLYIHFVDSATIMVVFKYQHWALKSFKPLEIEFVCQLQISSNL